MTARRPADDETARDAAARLAAIVESADDAIISKTLDGIITSWNRAAERMFGYSETEAVGQPILMIVPPERHDEERDILRHVQGGEALQPFETERLGKDGRRIPISLTVSPIRNAAGRTVGASKIARDISGPRRAEEALRQSEARYRAIVEDQLDLVCRFRSDGTLTFVNEAYCRYFGLGRQEVIDTRYAPIVHPEDLPRVDAVLAALSPDNPVATIENRVVHADGSIRWTQWTNRALYDGQGRLLEFQSAGRDITARKEQEARLRFAARASEVLASSLDYEATLRQVARVAVPDIAEGCAVDLVTPDNRLERVAVAHTDPEAEAFAWEAPARYERPAGHPLYRVVQSGQARLCEHVTDEIRDGLALDPAYARILNRRWFESFMIVPLKGREQTLGTITLAIGHGRRYTPADVAFVEDLARRAAQAVENARLYREVKAANRAKDEFLAMLAHELRNPLGVIVNALSVLDGAGDQGAGPQRARMLIRRQTDHLARLLDDLLDVARITSGHIDLREEPVDLRAAVDVAVEGQRHRIEAKRQALHVAVPDTPVLVLGDAARLQQVLGNLLNNACKYTPAGGTVWLTLAAESDRALLRVRDNGSGIPTDELESIFTLFTQANPTLAHTEGGLGIGLTLVRRVVQLHGGSVSAASAGPGAGAEFQVRLPLAGAPVPPLPPPPRAAGVAPRQIVIIEDNADAREMLATALRLDGHEVHEAATGHDGIAQAVQYAPDVVLVDIGLPDADGYEVCRRLRAEMGRRTRLVALTGYGQPQDRERAYAAGFDAHLVKPVDPQRLADALA